MKTGTDPSARLVNLSSSTTTTLYALVRARVTRSIPKRQRVQSWETTVWSLYATLVKFRVEKDADYHLVLRDGGQTVIAELPSPACVKSGSPFLGAIRHARQQFNAAYRVTPSWHTVNVPLRIAGVGFFDNLHRQTGVALNGIELHPVTAVQVGMTPAPIPTLAPTSGPTVRPTAANTAVPTATDVPTRIPTSTPIPVMLPPTNTPASTIPFPTSTSIPTALIVSASVSPNPVAYGQYATLSPTATPGATCTASVTYSTGRSPTSFSGYAQLSTGTVSWQ